ncbi:hypothetical protein GCM10010525_30450 [Glutamicibacter bergerei]
MGDYDYRDEREYRHFRHSIPSVQPFPATLINHNGSQADEQVPHPTRFLGRYYDLC